MNFCVLIILSLAKIINKINSCTYYVNTKIISHCLRKSPFSAKWRAKPFKSKPSSHGILLASSSPTIVTCEAQQVSLSLSLAIQPTVKALEVICGDRWRTSHLIGVIFIVIVGIVNANG